VHHESETRIREIEGEGIVEYSEEDKRWIAKVEWDKVRDRSANAS
jgi:hypothetical protein